MRMTRWIDRIVVSSDYNVAISHRWDRAIDSGEMEPIYHGDIFVESIMGCMKNCRIFWTCFLKMLWSGVYNAN